VRLEGTLLVMTGKTCAKGHPYEGNRQPRRAKNGTYTSSYCKPCQADLQAGRNRLLNEAAAHLGISAKVFRTRYGSGLPAIERVLAGPPAEPIAPPAAVRGHQPRLDPKPHEWLEGCTVLVLCTCGYRSICLDPADARDAFTQHARA
jgi:hypothetical protein